MKKIYSYNHIIFYCILLVNSIFFYGLCERALIALNNNQHASWMDIIRGAVLGILMSYISKKIYQERVTFASLQKIPAPALVVLLIVSVASTIKNISSFITDYSNIVAAHTPSFFEGIGLVFILIWPLFIAFHAAQALRAKYRL